MEFHEDASHEIQPVQLANTSHGSSDPLFNYLRELSLKLERQTKLNAFLEAQNKSLKTQNEPKEVIQPVSIDYNKIAQKYGTSLAQDIESIINENRFLRPRLAKSYRETASLQSKLSTLSHDYEALHQQQFNLQTKLFSEKLSSQGGASYILSNRDESQLKPRRQSELKDSRLAPVAEKSPNSRGEEKTEKYCACTEKLVELQDIVENGLSGYEMVELNIELERRLGFESNISRNWQINLRALQRELRDHFYDLANVSRLSGPACSVFMGELTVASTGSKQTPSSLTRTEKESLALLQKARNRIEGDSKRLEAHCYRIKELEDEVASLRKCELAQRNHVVNTNEVAHSFARLLQFTECYYRDKIIFDYVLQKLHDCKELIKKKKANISRFGTGEKSSIKQASSPTTSDKMVKEYLEERMKTVAFKNYATSSSLALIERAKYLRVVRGKLSIWKEYNKDKNLLKETASNFIDEKLELNVTREVQIPNFKLSDDALQKNVLSVAPTESAPTYQNDRILSHPTSKPSSTEAGLPKYAVAEEDIALINTDFHLIDEERSRLLNVDNLQEESKSHEYLYKGVQLGKRVLVLKENISTVKKEIPLKKEKPSKRKDIIEAAHRERADKAFQKADSVSTKTQIEDLKNALEEKIESKAKTKEQTQAIGTENAESKIIIVENNQRQIKNQESNENQKFSNASVQIEERNHGIEQDKDDMLREKDLEFSTNQTSTEMIKVQPFEQIEPMLPNDLLKNKNKITQLQNEIESKLDTLSKKQSEKERIKNLDIETTDKLQDPNKDAPEQLIPEQVDQYVYTNEEITYKEDWCKDQKAAINPLLPSMDKIDTLQAFQAEEMSLQAIKFGRDSDSSRDADVALLAKSLSDNTTQEVKLGLDKTQIQLSEHFKEAIEAHPKDASKVVFTNENKESLEKLKKKFKEEILSKKMTPAEVYREMSEGKNINGVTFEEWMNFLEENDFSSIPIEEKDIFFNFLAGENSILSLRQLYEVLEGDVTSLESLGKRLTEAYLSIREALKQIGHSQDEDRLSREDFISDESDVSVGDVRGHLSGQAYTSAPYGESSPRRSLLGAIRAVTNVSRLAHQKKSGTISTSLLRQASLARNQKLNSSTTLTSLQQPPTLERLATLIRQLSTPIDEMTTVFPRMIEEESTDGMKSICRLSSLTETTQNLERSMLILPFCYPSVSDYDELTTSEQTTSELTTSELTTSTLVQSDGSSSNSTDEELRAENSSGEAEEHSIAVAASLLHERVIDKYGSCFSAFRFMDENGNGNVATHEFANFMEDLGFEYSFPRLCEIYNHLCKPVSGCLTASALYRNLEGDSCSMASLHRRLEEMYCDPAIPFHDLEITQNERVYSEHFIQICAKVGVGYTHAISLWKNVDLLENDFITLSNLLILLEGSASIEEVRKAEEDATKLLSVVWGIIAAKPVAQETSSTHMTREQLENLPTDTNLKLQWGLNEKFVILDDMLETQFPWSVLRFEERQRVFDLLIYNKWKPNERIQAEGDTRCPMFLLVSGKVNLMQQGIFFESVKEEIIAPSIIFSQTLLEDMPNEYAIVVPEDSGSSTKEVITWTLERNAYNDNLKELLQKRQGEVEEIQQMMAKVAVLHKLSVSGQLRLAAYFEKNFFTAGEAIIREFDEPEYFYLISKGKASAIKEVGSPEPEELRIYQVADYFGEISLIRNQTRTATIIAKTDCECLLLNKENFHWLLGKLQDEFIRRADKLYAMNQFNKHTLKKGEQKKHKKKKRRAKIITAENNQDDAIPKNTLEKGLKSDESYTLDLEIEETLAFRLIRIEKKMELDELMLILETVPILKDLTLDRRQHLVQDLELEMHYPNAPIVIEGEKPDKFFILKSGTVSVELYQGPGKLLKPVRNYSSAEYFGEMSFIKNEKRTAYIIAITPVHVYSLQKEKFFTQLRDQFDAFIARARVEYRSAADIELETTEFSSKDTENELVKAGVTKFQQLQLLMSSVPVTQSLDKQQLVNIVKASRIMEYMEREIIFEEGNRVHHLCIIIEGEVLIQHSWDEVQQTVSEVLHDGQFLAQIEFFTKALTTFSCVAKCKVKLLCITKEALKLYLDFENFPILSPIGFYGRESISIKGYNFSQSMSNELNVDKADEETRINQTGDEMEIERKSFLWHVDDEKKYYQRKKLERRASQKGSLDSEHGGDYNISSVTDKNEIDSKRGLSSFNEFPTEESQEATNNLKKILKTGELDDDELRMIIFRTELKNRFETFANAFRMIQPNIAETVNFKNFSRFVKSMNIDHCTKLKERKILFESLLLQPQDTISIGSFYQNLEAGEIITIEVLKKRLTEVYGSVWDSLQVVCGENKEDCGLIDFQRLCSTVGINEGECIGLGIFTDGDNDSVKTFESVCSLIAGTSLRQTESYQNANKPPQSVTFFENVMGLWGYSTQEESQTQQVPDNSNQEIHTLFEEPLIVQRDDHRNFPDECKELKESIGLHAKLSYLSEEQSRYLTSLMKREVWVPGKRPLLQGSEDIGMAWLYYGDIDILQRSFWGYEVTLRRVATFEFIGADTLLSNSVIDYSAAVVGYKDAILWILEKEIYLDCIQGMLEERQRNFPLIVNFLQSILLLQEMSEENITEAAKACKTESYSAKQIISKSGRIPGSFYIVYSGAATSIYEDTETAVFEQQFLARGDYFGELSTLKHPLRKCTITSTSDTKLLTWNQAEFTRTFTHFSKGVLPASDLPAKRQPSQQEDLSPPQQVRQIRTRKSSLALSTYKKLRDQEKTANINHSSSNGETEIAKMRWELAPDPLVAYSPPSLDAVPGPSSLKSEFSLRKSGVSFDQETLLHSVSSEEDS
ncbi:hypothetical protein IE077_002986 [Cardiosporidium cionae]|uniref:Uncharacterized protein n=1 Tax=Cardiosporidium cionae TaxID=476202 RepID=A0ABQ7J9J0_9APIC|nr:hypothetical protein IE077_002986 [Cardiosporidium cionae]|eukprot:KAF8820623.1 hypothetical protein IE077_002986 [Cardiosporidium cionae]